MILSHNLCVVHCTVALLCKEHVIILVTMLSNLLLNVHYRPKSFDYPSNTLNSHYDARQLFLWAF